MSRFAAVSAAIGLALTIWLGPAAAAQEQLPPGDPCGPGGTGFNLAGGYEITW